jgi:epoxyqueuosine reductase
MLKQRQRRQDFPINKFRHRAGRRAGNTPFFFEFMFIDRKYLQRNAAVALGNYGDPQYVPILIEAFETKAEEMVRGHAAWALGRIGTSVAQSALKKHFKTDSSSAVKNEIMHVLGKR